jgi:SAM-dependent methyltransferase
MSGAKQSNEENLAHYERKYAAGSLYASLFFRQPFRYLLRNYAREYSYSPGQFRLIDIGGGTGEFSKAISEFGFDVTCFDFSANAIAKAKEFGVKTIQGDLYTYPFAPQFHLAFAKGFSCLNTDSPDEFAAVSQRIGQSLLPGGIGLYWAYTDLSGQWSSTNWYNFSIADLRKNFGEGKFVLLLSRRIQAFLPHAVNVLISNRLCAMENPILSVKPTIFARLRTGNPAGDDAHR